jgi:hypothetical protein
MAVSEYYPSVFVDNGYGRKSVSISEGVDGEQDTSSQCLRVQIADHAQVCFTSTATLLCTRSLFLSLTNPLAGNLALLRPSASLAHVAMEMVDARRRRRKQNSGVTRRRRRRLTVFSCPLLKRVDGHRDSFLFLGKRNDFPKNKKVISAK